MFELAIKFLISYLLGSISGALTVGKFKNNTDIRDIGSGNAGLAKKYSALFRSCALDVVMDKDMLMV